MLAAAGDDRGRTALERGLSHRLFKVRHLAILGLARLAERGDAAAREVLLDRAGQEPDPRLAEVLEARLAELPMPAPARTVARAEAAVRDPDTGLRMLLVLIGLLSLLAMAFLPLLVRWRRRLR